MNFKNKTFLITGGTGSFGNAVLKKLQKQILKKLEYLVEMKKNSMTLEKLMMTELNSI